MCRPPAASTSCFSASHWALNFAKRLLVGGLLLGRQLVPRLAGVLRVDLGARHELGVAAEDDVGAAAGHVGRDGDRALAPRLGDDEASLLVLLGVQHVVRDPLLAQQRGDHLGLLDADGADQHRLAALWQSSISSQTARNLPRSFL